jgi:hypothetical protein
MVNDEVSPKERLTQALDTLTREAVAAVRGDAPFDPVKTMLALGSEPAASPGEVPLLFEKETPLLETGSGRFLRQAYYHLLMGDRDQAYQHALTAISEFMTESGHKTVQKLDLKCELTPTEMPRLGAEAEDESSPFYGTVYARDSEPPKEWIDHVFHAPPPTGPSEWDLYVAGDTDEPDPEFARAD